MPTGIDPRAAARRLSGHVRRTPVMDLTLPGIGAVALKLESLQVGGSFKIRGATNRLALETPERLAAGVVAASGGNHGIGTAAAAAALGVPARIFVPRSTTALKRARIAGFGAEVVVEGEDWFAAQAAAEVDAARRGGVLVHPFDDDAVIEGQATVGIELLEQMARLDTLLVAVGGGGLVSGIALAVKAARPEVRIIAVEPVGAPTLHTALAAGRPVVLDRVATAAPTLAARVTSARVVAIAAARVERVVLIDDEAMRAAARLLWDEAGIAAELAGAAGLAALVAGAYTPTPGEVVASLVCGAGLDGIGA